MTGKLGYGLPAQGWLQFLDARKEMLDRYDSARTKAGVHEVPVYHGGVAEEALRAWLGAFLPKKYAVTAGYVISQGMQSPAKAPHFDVIIYDSLNSPVLWVESAGITGQPKSMAIPAEHVLAVLEVKARLTPKNMKDAITHLGDLSALLSGTDAPGERYGMYLPERFFCGVVFFELLKADSYKESSLSNALSGLNLRGFIGGAVLRGEGHQRQLTGTLEIYNANSAIDNEISKSGQSMLCSGGESMSMVLSKSSVLAGMHLGGMLKWSEPNFSQFAFDLLARLQGTFERGRLSSWHGQGTSEWEQHASRGSKKTNKSKKAKQ